jgi:hypothetical protein
MKGLSWEVNERTELGKNRVGKGMNGLSWQKAELGQSRVWPGLS